MGIITNRRRVMGGGQPLPYDAVVEYLCSTDRGGQRIDTGIVNYGFTTIRVVEKFSFPNKLRKMLIGNYFINQIGTINIELTANKLRFYSRNKKKTTIDYADTNVLPINTVIQSDILADCANGTFSFSVEYNDVIFNGNAPFSTDNPCEGTLTMCLFRDWRAQDDVSNVISLYQCSIRCDGVLVRDFIPVRVGQVGYMYDRVSGKLFGNAGTGAFVVGPDVNGN